MIEFFYKSYAFKELLNVIFTHMFLIENHHLDMLWRMGDIISCLDLNLPSYFSTQLAPSAQLSPIVRNDPISSYSFSINIWINFGTWPLWYLQFYILVLVLKLWSYSYSNISVPWSRECDPLADFSADQNWGLVELRQYENDLTEPNYRLVLKLPRFSPHRIGEWKARQFQN